MEHPFEAILKTAQLMDVWKANINLELPRTEVFVADGIVSPLYLQILPW